MDPIRPLVFAGALASTAEKATNKQTNPQGARTSVRKGVTQLSTVWRKRTTSNVPNIRPLISAFALGAALFISAPTHASECLIGLCWWPWAGPFSGGAEECGAPMQKAWSRVWRGESPHSCDEVSAAAPPYHLFRLKRYDGTTQQCGFSRLNGSGDYACRIVPRGWYAPGQSVNGRQLDMTGGANFIIFKNPMVPNEYILRFASGNNTQAPPESVFTELKAPLAKTFAGGSVSLAPGDRIVVEMSTPPAEQLGDIPPGITMPDTSRDGRLLGPYVEWNDALASQVSAERN